MVISKLHPPVAAVYNRADSCKRCSGTFDECNHLCYRAACGDDILNNQYTLIGFKCKAAADSHDTLLAFSKDGFDAELASNFRSYHNSPDCRRYDCFYPFASEMLRNFPADCRQVFRMLQDLCALKVGAAVTAGCQFEMAIKQGSGVFEDVKHGCIVIKIIAVSVKDKEAASKS